MKFFALGSDILSTEEYAILATAVNDEMAEYLANLLNAKGKIDSESNEPIETWKCPKCGVDCSSTTCYAEANAELEDEDSFEKDWCDFCAMSVTAEPVPDQLRGNCPHCGEMVS